MGGLIGKHHPTATYRYDIARLQYVRLFEGLPRDLGSISRAQIRHLPPPIMVGYFGMMATDSLLANNNLVLTGTSN